MASKWQLRAEARVDNIVREIGQLSARIAAIESTPIFDSSTVTEGGIDAILEKEIYNVEEDKSADGDRPQSARGQAPEVTPNDPGDKDLVDKADTGFGSADADGRKAGMEPGKAKKRRGRPRGSKNKQN